MNNHKHPNQHQSPEPAMTNFVWHGINRQGNRIQGECREGSECAARDRLLREGINVTSLRRARPGKGSLFRYGSKPLQPNERAEFLRKLATLSVSGIPLLNAFEILAGPGSTPAAAELANDLGRRLREGARLAEALNSRPADFDRIARAMIAAGERAGTLEVMLERVAHHQETQMQLRERIDRALFYPSVVVGFGIVVTLALLLGVVPRFAMVFAGLGGELPTLTRLVFSASETARDHTEWILAGLVGALVLRFLRPPERFRELGFTILNYLPLLGRIQWYGTLTQISRTLGTLYGAGVPLVEALEQTADTVAASRTRQWLRATATEMRGGSSLNRALRATGRFPHAFLGMIQVGEESGRLEVMLQRTSELYQSDLDRLLDRVMSLIEPVTMAILGILVGGLVLAMYLPIFMLGQTL